MKRRWFMAIMLPTLLIAGVAAQGNPDIEKLEEKLSRHIQSKMLGWTHRRVEPFMNSSSVLVEKWSLPDKGVMIQVVSHKSPQEALEALRALVKYESQTEQLKGFGEEAYAWGYGLSNVAFVRGKFVVYTSSSADAEGDARSLTPRERGERERSEMRRLSRDFAKHASNALDLP